MTLLWTFSSITSAWVRQADYTAALQAALVVLPTDNHRLKTVAGDDGALNIATARAEIWLLRFGAVDASMIPSAKSLMR